MAPNACFSLFSRPVGVFFSRLLFPITTALFIVVIAKVLLLAFAISFFCKQGLGIEKVKRYLFAAVTIAILVIPFKTDPFTIFRMDMNHFSAPFFALILAGILLKPIETSTFFRVFAAFFIGFIPAVSSPASVLALGILGGSILLVKRWELIRPLPLKSYIVRYKTLCFKKDVITFIVFSVGLLSGYLLYANFINPSYLGERLWGANSFTPEHRVIIEGLAKSFNILRGLYAYILLSNVTIFVIITSFFLNSKNSLPSKIKSIYISLLIAFPLTYLAFSVAGAILVSGYHRYFYALQILTILIALYVIDKQKNIWLKGIPLLLVILSIITYKDDFSINTQQLPEESRQLASCVNENIRLLDSDERVVLGITNFWNANVLQVQLSDNRIDVFVMSPIDTGALLWMQNVYTSNSVIDRFYFAIRNGERHLFPIHEQETINCSEGGWSLLSYGSNNQSAIEFVKSYSSYLLSQLDLSIPKVMWHGDWLPNSTAKQQKLNGVLKSEGPGFVHFGPYIALDKGHYYVEIFYSLKTGNINSKDRTEVVCINKKNSSHTIASVELSQGIGLISRIEFSTSPDDNCSDEYIFRTWIDKGTTIYLNHLTIAKLPNDN